MEPDDQKIDQLMSSDLQSKRDRGMALSYRQNTQAIHALANRTQNIQRAIATYVGELSKALDAHGKSTSRSVDKLAKALEAADESSRKAARGTFWLTVALAMATIVQAAVAVIALNKLN